MKRLLLSIILGIIITHVHAQSPEGIKYQAVIRDATGNIISDQSIGLQITILQGSASGTEVYKETFTPTSNSFGLVNLEIGNGTVVSGTFSAIDWGSGPYFIETALDPTGGSSFTVMGTSQLMSVPYALHSKTAESVTTDQVDDADADPTNELQTITISNDSIYLSNGGFIKLPANSGFSGSFTDLSNVPPGLSDGDDDTQLDSTQIASMGFVAGAHTVDTDTKLTEAEVDAFVGNNGYLTAEIDGSTTNEIQAISISNDTIFLSNGGFVKLPGGGSDTLSIIADVDRDTKIQVEESADEDIIRFDLAGNEKWVMTGSRLESKNAGGSIFIGEGAGSNDDLSSNYNVFIGTSSGLLNTTGFYNTAIGYQSMLYNTTGFSNVSVGDQALKSNTTGFSNSSIGRFSMYSNTTGTQNTAMGNSAMEKNTSGSVNTALGNLTLWSNTNGSFNTALGSSTMYLNQGGSSNTALGRTALYSNISGNYNVAIGRDAGNKSLGNGNIFVGYQSGYNETGSGKLYIENSNSSTPLIYGDFTNDSLKVYGTLSVGDNYTLPANDGTANQVMTTDGSGNVSWQNASSPTKEYAVYQDRKANATNGGTASQAWNTRTLNYTSEEVGTSISRSSDTLILASGTYHIVASAPALASNHHQIKIRNFTDSADEIYGTSELSRTTDLSMTRSFINDILVVTGGPKKFLIQHWITDMNTDNLGWGAHSLSGGAPSIFTTVFIEKY